MAYPILKRLRLSPPGRAAAWLKREAVLWRRQRLAQTILRLPPKRVPAPGPEQVSVHLLTSRRDWLGALWAVRTFLQQLDRDMPVVFHEDGTLPNEAKKHLLQSLPGAVIWDPAEAAKIVSACLQNYPQCAAARTRHPTMLKLFDISLLAPGERYLTLDSDLLFFNRPVEIDAWLEGKPRLNLWNRDIASSYNITPEQAQAWYGISLQERINSGFGAVWKSSFDLDLVEDLLRRESLWREPHRTEQTALAVLSSRFGGKVLPGTYLVDTNRSVGLPDGLIMKHYVGVIRDLFFAEGIVQLLQKPPFAKTSGQ